MTFATLVVGGLVALATYMLYSAYWRLYLSPVAKFPARKLAALTFWYEFYYDVLKGGAYVYEIENMHRELGPIIRINPYELSVSDPDLDFLNRLYPSVGHRVDKFWWSAGMFGSTDMTFGTVPHELHRIRRAAFGRFFSRAYILRLEPVLQDLIDKMVRKVEDAVEGGGVVNLVHAFSALTQDVITEYCFSSSRNVLDKEGFAPHWYEWMQVHCSFTPVIKQFPWLLPALNLVPDRLVKVTSDPISLIRLQKSEYRAMAEAVIAGGTKDTTSHPTIFHEILRSPSLLPHEKTVERMTAEATSFVGAGTLTVAHMLSLTVFFIFKERRIYERLASEFREAIPDADSEITLQKLEGLPYLSAVVDEGLRLSYGSMHRLSRSHPDQSLRFRDWTIPPGTPVGTSAYLIHTNPAIFSEPHTFRPERWLDLEASERRRLKGYLCNFGRGTRQCVGMRLAYAEIYLSLGHIVRRLGSKLEVFETEYERDIAFVRDYFIPAPGRESRGCRVVEAQRARRDEAS